VNISSEGLSLDAVGPQRVSQIDGQKSHINIARQYEDGRAINKLCGRPPQFAAVSTIKWWREHPPRAFISRWPWHLTLELVCNVIRCTTTFLPFGASATFLCRVMGKTDDVMLLPWSLRSLHNVGDAGCSLSSFTVWNLQSYPTTVYPTQPNCDGVT